MKLKGKKSTLSFTSNSTITTPRNLVINTNQQLVETNSELVKKTLGLNTIVRVLAARVKELEEEKCKLESMLGIKQKKVMLTSVCLYVSDTKKTIHENNN